MKLQEVASHINGELIGDPSIDISGIATLKDSQPGQLSFVLEKRFISLASQSKASAFIVFQKIKGLPNQIVVQKTRKALAMVIELFFSKQLEKKQVSISDKAAIHLKAQIEEGVGVGAFAVIGETVVKKGSQIHANATIGDHCEIGENCNIHSNVVIYDNVKIGNNVIIHSGSVIGADGYGYYPEEGKWNKIPHIGRVVIEDNVEIGANSCVDRGCLGDTVIKSGTKIDNLIQIAHNTNIGHNCAIAALVGITGSSTLEDNVSIGGQAGVSSSVIGKQSIIAAKAGVTKDIPEKGVYSGFPAWEHAKELKKEATLRKLINKK